MIIYSCNDNREKTFSSSYTLYMANTNFPVVFEDGNWSSELKNFIITDLNRFNSSIEYLKSIKSSPVQVKLNNKSMISTNIIECYGKYSPWYVDESLDYLWGNIISINNVDHILLTKHVLNTYKTIFNLKNDDRDIFDKLNVFMNKTLINIKDMSKSNLVNNLIIIDPPDLILTNSYTISDEDYKSFKTNFGEIMFTSSYTTLYILPYNELYKGYGKKNIRFFIKDSITIFFQVCSSKGRLTELQAVYVDGKWKLMIVVPY